MGMTRSTAGKLIETYDYRTDVMDKRAAIYNAVKNDLSQFIDCRGVCASIPFELSVPASAILDVFDQKIVTLNKEIIALGGEL